jgi:hypothetical protein
VFEPASLVGMAIGILVIAGGTFLLVRGHMARERDAAEAAGLADAPPPRDGSGQSR